ncbi:MAG: tetratricopeptide repeat protein [Candidatus Eremiobacteraeota bacterium]|nr:tetratricopeptide repeat protein [Candidatus Eremiobacteraeota bacterium]MCW5871766.1 tetratricopeptide repeat protein [Candidatus Eremiobacteraeota bacterium]
MRHQPTEETAKADEAFKKRHWKDAEDSFQRILTRVPEHIEAYLGLFETQAVLGHFTSSVQTLWQAVEICEQTNQLEQGLEIIARILELKPHHEQALQKRIDLLFGNQRNSEAVAFSRDLAQWYLENDNVDAAIRLLLRAFQINHDDLELTLVLAEAYLTNGQMREATGLFRQVIPHFLEAQDWEKAAGIMRRLSLMDPKDPRNFMEMGDLYIKLERYQEADQQFRAVLRIDLNHREALLKIAEVSLLRKLFRDASMVYNRLITLSSDDAEAHEGLGMVYKGQGMQADAAKHLLMAGLAFADKDVKARAHSCFAAVLEIDPANNIASRQMKILAPGV